MEGSIELTCEERKILLKAYRSGASLARSRQAHIVLLLADGLSYRQVRQVLYVSHDLIAKCVHTFRCGGVVAIVEGSSPKDKLPGWLTMVIVCLTSRTPHEFGYFRSRWSCDMLAEVLAWETGQRVSRESIRRRLRQTGFAWRRPRPVLGPRDSEYERKLQHVQDVLASLRDDETALFEDEVDIQLNPKIGSCWMLRGQQAQLVTPGNNVKRHLAGSLVWRTGSLLVSPPGPRRNAELFVSHLDDLRRRLRSYRRLHVICDNAAFHKSRLVQSYLQRWGHRIVLHYLPTYAPETNPIERVWWRLHETITRNHRCQTIEELLARVDDWVDCEPPLPIQSPFYPPLRFAA